MLAEMNCRKTTLGNFEIVAGNFASREKKPSTKTIVDGFR
jgi:hypothetical protein